jgi:hypothetical protein
MTTRIILAGVLGAIAMFVWTSIAHMCLPLGETGIREIPNESAVIDALRTNLGDNHGFFIFPGLGVGPNPSREAKHEAMSHMEEKLADSPSGLLLYHPRRPFNFPRRLITEFATEVLEAIIVVFLLAQTRLVTFSGRVGFVTVAGILVAIATNVSYWNWYGFPKRYTAAYMFIQVIGFLCIGLVAALVLGRNRSTSAPAAPSL